LVRKPKEKDHLKEVDVDVRIIWKCVWNKSHMGALSGFILLWILSSDSYELCNEPPGSIKGGEFTDQMSDY
jgi:hypothetical protein